MLLDCAECGHSVSSRALACPKCGFPVAEDFAQRELAQRHIAARAARRQVGETDCIPCEARGFTLFDYSTPEGHTRKGFDWCDLCKHSGRVPLVQDPEGFYAVAHASLPEFLVGERDADGELIRELGREAPQGHRYPTR